MQELSNGTTGNSGAHEEEPKDLEVGISIRGLIKVYKEVCIRTTSVGESLHLPPPLSPLRKRPIVELCRHAGICSGVISGLADRP